LDVGTLVSKDDEALDLTESQKVEAKRRTSEGNAPAEPDSGGPESEGYHYRDMRPPTNGLLLIYPLDPMYLRQTVDNPDDRHKGNMNPDPSCNYDYPIMGIVTSFSASPTAAPIKYRVNLVYSKQDGGNGNSS
jgi:hypothetical protein